MSETLASRFKWFWIWQDDKEEAWLADMSRQGLHLKSVGLFGRYLFERGEVCEYAYFMDFATRPKDREEDTKVLQNTGWKHISQLGNRRYWRKKAGADEAPDLHPKSGLLLRKYQRMLGLLIIYLPIFIILLTRADDVIQRYQYWAVEVIFAAFFALFLLYLFTVVMLSRRVLTLRGPAKEK